jgi:Flp pilus assembly secretin CpaC
MRLREITCVIGLIALSMGQTGTVHADDVPRASSNQLTAIELVTEEAIPKLVVIQMMIIELRGDVQSALKHAGFRESAVGNRYFSETQEGDDRDAHHLITLLQTLKTHAEVEVLSRPTVRAIIGQSATVFVGQTLAGIPYLVRTGPKSFELRETEVKSELGFGVELTPNDDEQAERIELSPLKIFTKTIDGREPIAGLDLDVGKPILSTRTLETSITLTNGSGVNGIALPGPPGRQAVIFLSAHRMKNENLNETLPNPIPVVVPTRKPVPAADPTASPAPRKR